MQGAPSEWRATNLGTGRRRGLRWLTAALAALALFAAPARAMPGDPEIVNVAPGNFQQTFLSGGSLVVTFTCPAYRTGAAGSIADGDASDYSVRLAGANTGPDGRLPAPGSSSAFGGEGFSEAAAQPIPGTSNCTARLPMSSARGPAALFFGGVDWQVARRCPGCGSGSEIGPVSWAILLPGIEGPGLTTPKRIYAGYLTRFGFATVTDLRGTTIGLQRMSRRGWSDLDRAPFVPGAESVFFAKLPAGRRLLRIDAAEVADPLIHLGLPYQEVTVLKPGRRRATGPGSDGPYVAPPADAPALSLEVVGDGARVRRLKATVPVTCPGPPSSTATVTARLRSARIAPDGTVVGRALTPGATPTYVTLDGHVGRRRFTGTVTAATGPCSGSAVFEAEQLPSAVAHGGGPVRSSAARAPRP